MNVDLAPREMLTIWALRKGFSRSGLADAIGVARPTLTKIIEGNRAPKLVEIIRIDELTEGFIPSSLWIDAYETRNETIG